MGLLRSPTELLILSHLVVQRSSRYSEYSCRFSFGSFESTQPRQNHMSLNVTQWQKIECRRDAAFPLPNCPHKGTIFIAEQLTFDQILLNRGTFDGHTGLRTAMTVQVTLHQLLASPAFAQQQYGGAGSRKSPCLLQQTVHVLRLIDKGHRAPLARTRECVDLHKTAAPAALRCFLSHPVLSNCRFAGRDRRLGKAVSLVQTAKGTLSEINSLLVKARSLAIDSANDRINDANALAANQTEIDNALDTINRIADNTQFGTKKLLDGSAAINGTSSNTAGDFFKGPADTTAGPYAITVTTAGEHGTETSTRTQTQNLAADEVLMINDVSTSLTKGLSQTQVVNRINEFTAQTGIVADTVSEVTRLYTQAFGSAAQVRVVSNVADAPTGSGFGTTLETDDRIDIIGTIGGTTFNGTGNILTADSVTAKGLSIQVEGSSGDTTTTGTAVTATISVTDNSLQFQIGPNQNQTANIAIDRSWRTIWNCWSTDHPVFAVAPSVPELLRSAETWREQAGEILPLVHSAG